MSYLQRVAEAYGDITFSSDELAYYARHLLLPSVGTVGQQKLKAARVLVLGAGGLGCPVLQALAGAGVGMLTVVDGDVVSISNVSRQWLHTVAEQGTNKANSAAGSLSELNPYIAVTSVAEMLTEGNAGELIAAHDLVVDATDDLEVRYLIDSVCAELDRPWVHAALYRDSSQICVFWDRCGARFADLFPERGDAPSCAGAGMLGAAASVAANLQALEVIKLITGNGTPKVGEVVSIHTGSLQLQSFRMQGVAQPEQFAELASGAFAMTVDDLLQERSIGASIEELDVRAGVAETILERGLPESGASKIVLICEEGLVSGLLAEALRRRGYEQVYHLEGGYQEYS